MPQSCLKMLKHGHSKVLNAQLRGGVVVVGCQYGLVVLWDLEEVLSSPYFALDIDREFGRLQIEICSLQCREKQEVINFQRSNHVHIIYYKNFFQLSGY